jgi:fluoride exporter
MQMMTPRRDLPVEGFRVSAIPQKSESIPCWQPSVLAEEPYAAFGRSLWFERSVRVQRYLLIAAGGALGAMLRYFIGVLAAERFGPRFPVGTLTINVSACFMIGLLLEYLNHHAGMNPAWRYGIAVGFIGAFSTFSTFEWETWVDLTNGAFWLGILYVAVSLVLGMVAVALGSLSARALS